VAEYAAQRRSSSGWMLGRFVAPVARLDELATVARALSVTPDGAWPVSALASADPVGDAERLRAFGAKTPGPLVVESVELRAATPDAVARVLSPMDPSLERYVEIPLEEDPRAWLHAIKRHGGRAKVRTGGVTADAFPEPHALARFIVACAELDVPFKATAGLHHPLRGEQPLTYERDATSATMFGFLGVFVAAALARQGADEGTVMQVLEERDAGAFSFAEDTLRWRDRVLDAGRLGATRHDFAVSFGSCSFSEPVNDLRRIGVL